MRGAAEFPHSAKQSREAYQALIVYAAAWIVMCMPRAVAQPDITREMRTLNRCIAVDDTHVYLGEGSMLTVLARAEFANADPVSTTTLAGLARRMHLEGSTLYIANGQAGLTIFDISNPVAPDLLASVDTPGDAWDVAIASQYAWIADGPGGVHVVDIGDLENPRRMATWRGAEVYGATLADGRAYLASGFYDGLEILDATDPTAPRSLGSLNTPGRAYGIALSGERAYLADGFEGLTVCDISDPAAPALVYSDDTPGYAHELTIRGSTLYVADGESGLRLYDITQGNHPQFITHYDPPGDVRAVTVDDTFAWLIGGVTDGVMAVDITNPIPMEQIGNYGLMGVDIAIADNIAYVADQRAGVRLFDISDSSTPVHLKTVKTPGAAAHVIIEGDRLYVADWTDDLWIYDRADPEEPQLLSASRILPFYGMRRLALIQNTLFAIDGIGGLQVYDVSDPTQPALIHTLFEGLELRDFVIHQSVLFLATRHEGLQVFDISELNDPRLLYGYIPEKGIYQLAFDGTYLFAGLSDNSLLIMDATDPTNLPIIGTLSRIGKLSAVGNRQFTARDSFLYVSSHELPLTIINAEDPTQPFVAGSYLASPNSAWFYHAILDTEAIIVGAGLAVIDISVPNDLQQIGEFPAPQSSYALAKGENLVVMDAGDGLWFFDVSDPARPELIGRNADHAYVRKMVLKDGFLIASAGETGLRMMNVMDPTASSWIGTYDTTGVADHMTLNNDRLFVADGEGGMLILDVLDPTSPTQLAAYTAAGAVKDVDVDGNRAYVLGATEMHILDITNIRDPTLMNSNSIPDYSHREIEASGSTILLTRMTYGGDFLEVYEHDGVSTPVLEARFSNDREIFAGDLSLSGSVAYLRTDKRVLALDVTNPQTPVVVGHYLLADRINRFSSSNGFVVDDGIAWWGASGTGLLALRMPSSAETVWRAARYATAPSTVAESPSIRSEFELSTWKGSKTVPPVEVNPSAPRVVNVWPPPDTQLDFRPQAVVIKFSDPVASETLNARTFRVARSSLLESHPFFDDGDDVPLEAAWGREIFSVYDLSGYPYQPQVRHGDNRVAVLDLRPFLMPPDTYQIRLVRGSDLNTERDAIYFALKDSEMLHLHPFSPYNDQYLSVLAGLKAIQNRYPDIHEIRHHEAWVSRVLVIRLTDEAAAEHARGEYDALESLNQQYGLLPIESNSTKNLYFYVPGPYHLDRLADLYQAAEGVRFAYFEQCCDGDLIRLTDSHYQFSIGGGDCPLGCTIRHYFDFNVTDGEPTLVGEFGSLDLEDSFENANRGRSSTPAPFVRGLNGEALDGEYGGVWPSGDGAAGGEFFSTFRLSSDLPDDPPSVGFSSTGAHALESDPSALIDVSLTGGGAPRIVVIDYATGGGMAIPGVDYTPTSGTLVFEPPIFTLPIEIGLLDDATSDGLKTIGITLTDEVNAELGIANLTLRIHDDELRTPTENWEKYE